MGMGANFHVLKEMLNREVRERFDHRHLNEDVPEFAEGEMNPTTENLARFVFERLAGRQPASGARLARVTVWESPGCSVTYSEEG